MKNISGLGLTLMALCGCASSVKYNYGSLQSPSGAQPYLRDQRSVEEKEAKVMSVNKSSCWFGIYKIGDEQIDPPKLQILTTYLEKNIAVTNKDTLTVNQFKIFNNIQRGMKSAISAMSLGLTSIVPSAGQIRSGGCADAFDLESNPDNKPSVIVLYDIRIRAPNLMEK